MTNIGGHKAFSISVLLITGLLMAGAVQPVTAGSPVVLTECNQDLKSGSYRLGANIDASGDCFVVTENFVTIDLAGYTVTGNDTGGGITDKGDGKRGIVVRNGGITGFAVGVDLNSSPAAHISGIVVTDNKGGTTTPDCDLNGAASTLAGIATGSASIVTDSIARRNSGIGIKVGSGSRVTGNVAFENGGIGICVLSASTVTGNAARRNGLDGLHTGSSSTVSGNTARQNERHGILANSGSNISGNTARQNDVTGLTVHCPSLVSRNVALDNLQKNLDLVTEGGRCRNIENLTRTRKKKSHLNKDDRDDRDDKDD